MIVQINFFYITARHISPILNKLFLSRNIAHGNTTFSIFGFKLFIHFLRLLCKSFPFLSWIIENVSLYFGVVFNFITISVYPIHSVRVITPHRIPGAVGVGADREVFLCHGVHGGPAGNPEGKVAACTKVVVRRCAFLAAEAVGVVSGACLNRSLSRSRNVVSVRPKPIALQDGSVLCYSGALLQHNPWEQAVCPACHSLLPKNLSNP